jgi:hypothetical protein
MCSRAAPQEWREYKLVYRRYASLYFCVGVDPSDNELITLEARPAIPFRMPMRVSSWIPGLMRCDLRR